MKNTEAVLSLKKLNVVCVIGSEPHERLKDQSVEVTIDLGLNNLKPLNSDSLDDAIDYTKVAHLCQETAHHGKFHLLEALTYALANALVDAYDVKWVKVAAFKPRTMANLEGSVVEILLKKRGD